MDFFGIYGRANTNIISLDGVANGSARLLLRDKDEHALVGMSGYPDRSSGFLSIYTNNEVKIIASADEEGRISTYDANGDELVLLTSTSEGMGMVIVYDPSGRRKRDILVPLP
ncbi:MAG: hypothetical protein H6813_03605 [Phycisphaeraceae bacterium]|nr:hypothetical protein [Phycisphaeraceae bacterium]MCB9847033.1 hypothetical protein [Phycisphaeraceae bacterium]